MRTERDILILEDYLAHRTSAVVTTELLNNTGKFCMLRR